MFQLVQRRRYYLGASLILVLLGLLMMGYSFLTTGSPFRLSIEFVGGSIYDLKFQAETTEQSIREVFAQFGQDDIIVQKVVRLTDEKDENRWSVRSDFVDTETSDQIIDALNEQVPLDLDSTQWEKVSPTIGGEVTRSAFWAVLTASIVVTGFIVLAFRRVPNAIRYGVCAIVAMLHDILIMMGVISLAGIFWGWEVDALFLTAVLTVVGFSVQDSIVMFDRIRENIPKHLGEPYETIVNRSVIETIHRSLATQLNAFFVMIAILLFGGVTVKQFIAILLIGLISGTYSSIFIAVPLLVEWEKRTLARLG
ncbi:MAG: protein translocase subunit SecF [Phototrophicaceae bacterium]